MLALTLSWQQGPVGSLVSSQMVSSTYVGMMGVNNRLTVAILTGRRVSHVTYSDAIGTYTFMIAGKK